MRVTNSMLVNRFVGNLNVNLNKMTKIQTQMTKNRKYASISDDPVSVIYAQQARYRLARIADYQQNVSVAREWNTQTETALTEINNLLADAYVACVDMSNDNKTAEDRRIASEKVGQIRDQLLSTLNSTFGNKFVLGGYNTVGYPDAGKTTAPFEINSAGHLTLNGVDLMDRIFTGTAFAGGDIAGCAVTVDDNEKLQNALMGFPNADVSFSIAENNKLSIRIGKEKVTVENIADLAAVSFPETGITVDFSSLSSQFAKFGTDDFKDDLDALIGGNKIGFTSVVNPAIEDIFNRLASDVLSFNIAPSVEIGATMNGISAVLFNSNGDNLYNLLDNFYKAAQNGMEGKDLNEFISGLQSAQEHILALTAEIGARINRLDMVESRYEQDEINYTQMLSDAQDADQAELIMREKMAETVYKAALQTGAYIIQPTLMDFLR